MSGWEERFWSFVDKRSDGECWIWRGALGRGYGRFSKTRRKPLYAHRVAFELLVGPIPDGKQIDHLCRNRACVNPAHLESVTQRENILRGESPPAWNAARTECSQGHPYDDANTYRSNSHRRCRACAAAWKRNNRAEAVR